MKVEMKSGLLKKQTNDILQGLEQFGVELLQTPDQAEAVNLDLTAYVAAETAHKSQKENLKTRREDRNGVKIEIKDFSGAANQVLKTYLGATYNPEWETLKSSARSIKVPATMAELLEQLDEIIAHFTAHPTREVAAEKVTAAEAIRLRTAYSDTDAAYRTALTLTRNAAEVRDLAKADLRKRVRATFDLLARRLSDRDNRWLAFGVKRPVDTRIPAIPGKPVLIQHADGIVSLSWSKATRATRYRVHLLLPGEEAATVVLTVRVLMAELKDLPKGVKLTFFLTAANKAGESLPGEAAEITLI